ncbi:Peptidase C1 and/or Inhibitor I29 domain containing protein, partial [Asbolus verrucosus]
MKVFILTLIIAACLASNDPLLEQQWKSFKADFKKVYKSPNEEAIRFRNFEKNLNEINEHNEKYRKGLETYTLGLNQFADLSSEEIVSYTSQSQLKPSQSGESPFEAPLGAVPSTKNWKEEKVVTPVEDQGKDCKASWAFSTAGVIESNYAIREGKDKLVGLSPQNLIDCAKEYGESSCKGGNPEHALHFIDDYGIMKEIDYPYEARDGATCEFDEGKSVTKISKYIKIPSGSEEQLKKVVGLRGPVVANIHATSKFVKYDYGVFYDEQCSSVESNLNYTVLV